MSEQKTEQQTVATAKALIADAVVALLTEAKNQRLVDGYDATFWRDSYVLLRDAVVRHLGQFIRDDDVAEEAILVEAIERAGAAARSRTFAKSQIVAQRGQCQRHEAELREWIPGQFYCARCEDEARKHD